MHPFYKRFSFPVNIEEIIDKKKIDINWFIKYQEIISEVYLPPVMFDNNYDAHHALPLPRNEEIINLLKDIKEKTNIKLCIIYNDVYLSEEEQDYKIKQISDYIEKDQELKIDILVVPSKKWLKIKESFPDLIMKNTVVNFPSLKEIKEGKYDDYDYIYVHDEILHNHDKFLAIKGDRKYGCVVDFHRCRTDCIYKDSHYKEFKSGNPNAQDVIDTYCPAHQHGETENTLKANKIPSFYKSFEYFLDVLDIFKLQGRREAGSFSNAVKIIEDIYNKNERVGELDMLYNLDSFTILKWRHKIYNCTGICNGCTYCDDIIYDNSTNLL